LDRLTTTADIASYFEFIEPIVKETLEKRDIRSLGGAHINSSPSDTRPAELQMQPVFMFEQF